MHLRTRILASGAAVAALAVPLALAAPAAGASTPVAHTTTTMVHHTTTTERRETNEKRETSKKRDEAERRVSTKRKAATRRIRREVVVATYASRKAALAHLARLRRDGIRGFSIQRIRVHGRIRYRIEERGMTARTAAVKVRALKAHHLHERELSYTV